MKEEIAALLKPYNYKSVEELKLDLLKIYKELENARSKNQDKIAEKFQRYKEHLEKLLAEIEAITSSASVVEDLAVVELLASLACISLDDVMQKTSETKESVDEAKMSGNSMLIEEGEDVPNDYLNMLHKITGVCTNIDDFPVPPPPSKSSESQMPPQSLSRSSECQMPPESSSKSSKRQMSPESLPECAEKSLVSLHKVLTDGTKNLWFKSDNYVATSTLQSAQLEEQFERLRQQIKTEQLECGPLEKELERFDVLLKKCMAQETVSRKEATEMARLLFRVQASIRLLDVTALLDSVRQSSSAAGLIKDQDIIILLGSTGSGKSTMIHFLAGSKMRFTRVNGIRHLEPEVVMSGLADIKLSCTSTSETTGIHVAVIKGKEKTYTICDTAGLADTRGPEIDIASGITMTEAIRSAKSVKLVLFITEGALGDRFSSLRVNFVPSITRFLPSFKNYTGSIFYIFSKVSDDIENIASILDEFELNLEPNESSDEDFTAMITDLAEKTRKRQHCELPDLVNGDRLELLDGIDGVEPIINPRDAFHDFAAPKSIATLKDQLNMHREAVTNGQTRFHKYGDKSGLELMRYKLHQLLELRQHISLRECEEVYSDTMRSTFQFIVDLHSSTYKRIERVFGDSFAADVVDAELSDCMLHVGYIFDLENMRRQHILILNKSFAEHPVRMDDRNRIEWLEESSMQGTIEALFLRMQNDCKSVVEKYYNYIRSEFDDPTVIKNISGPSSATASLRLDKMCTLSRALNPELLSNQPDSAYALFSRINELHDGLLVEITDGVKGFIKSVEFQIESNFYSRCLPFFQQMKAFEKFELAPYINVSAEMLRCRDLFVEGITAYCEKANVEVEKDMSNSVAIFDSTIKEVLAVSSLTAFIEFIDMEKVQANQVSLVSRVGLACDKVSSEFQKLCEDNDRDLFNKVNASAAALDLLREEDAVSRGTAEQVRSLAETVRSALAGFRKQISSGIAEATRPNANPNGADGREEKGQDSPSHPSKCHSLKGLLLLIHDASTLQGELEYVYNNEFNEVIEEMKNVVLSCQLANGDGGVKLTFRDRARLSPYYDNGRAVFQLRETVDENTRDILGDLPGLFEVFLQKCDDVIAEAANEGIVEIKKFLGLTVADFKDNDEVFKSDVRDALLFFGTAKDLRSPTFPSDIQEATLFKVPVYFVELGNKIRELIDSVKSKRKLAAAVNAISEADDTLIEESVRMIRDHFFLLKSFEVWLTQYNGYYVTSVKTSIKETTEASSAAMYSLLEDLNTTVEKYGTEKIGPSMLPVLHSDYRICNLFFSVNQYLPPTDSTDSLNFKDVVEKFRTAITKIKSDTCDRIRIQDYRGILDDLKEFNRGDSTVSSDVRSILREVFTALMGELRKFTTTSATIKVGSTTVAELLLFIDGLRQLYTNSILFMTHLEDDQIKEINEGIEIANGIKEILYLICKECTSSVTNLLVTAAEGNFCEAEDILHFVEQIHTQLDDLDNQMQNAKTEQEPRITQLISLSTVEEKSLHSSGDTAGATLSSARQDIIDAFTYKMGMIDVTLSNVEKFCGKQINVVELNATPPSKIFEDLKRVEDRRPIYRTTATNLSNFFVSSISGSLNNALDYVKKNTTASENKNEVPQRGQKRKSVAEISETDQMAHASSPRNERGNDNILMEYSGTPDTDQISTLEECDELLKKIESFQPYLPSRVYLEYQPLLEETTRMIGNAKKTYESRIDQAVSMGAKNCYEGINLFYHFTNRQDVLGMKSVFDKLANLLRGFIDDMTAELKENKLASALATLQLTYEDWSNFIYDLTLWKDRRLNYPFFLQRFVKMSRNGRSLDIDLPIRGFDDLNHSIVGAVKRAIISISQADIVTMDPFFEGLVSFLEKTKLHPLLLDIDRELRRNASKSVLSVAEAFGKARGKLLKLLESMDAALLSSCDTSSANELSLVNSLISEAGQLVDISKKCHPLFLKVDALCGRQVLLGDQQNQLMGSDFPLNSYHNLNDLMNAAMEKIQKAAKPSMHGNQLLLTPNASDRNSFYRKMQFAFSLLIHWDSSQAAINGCMNVHTNEESCRNHIMKEIECIGAAADSLLSTTDYARLGILYDNLRSINENFSDAALKDKTRGRMDSIDSLFFAQIEVMYDKAWLTETEWNTNGFNDGFYDRIVTELISMKTISNKIALAKERIDRKYIDELLNEYKRRLPGGAGSSFFDILTTKLNAVRTTDAPIASQILDEHEAFYAHKLTLRNEKVLRISVSDMLLDLKGENGTGYKSEQLDNGTKNRLQDISKIFGDEYWSLVDAVLLEGVKVRETEIAAIIANSKNIANNADLPQKEKIITLMAHVFAYWTLIYSKHFQKKTNDEGDIAETVRANKSLLQPHAGQIVGILRLLGLDEERSAAPFTSQPAIKNPSNHFIEIGTGEGKSVMLAVSAVILAFLGFEVDVVCYSEYLTGRDYQSFKSMFSDFGLSESINYGTFKWLCEKFLNERGNIRESVSTMMSGAHEGNRFAERVIPKPRILLIDEVDVFFKKEFYGDIYKPYAQLKSQEITAFVKQLWKEYKSNKKTVPRSASIIKWPEYTACIKRYGDWDFFIEEALKMLITDLKNHDDPSHVYHVDCAGDKIGYKDHDSISYNTNIGYQTMFAYFKEHDAGKITDKGLDENIFFLVDCGDFSYAAVPKLYKSLLGVSGTLKELSVGEQEILRDVYEVKRLTYIPSVYGKNNLIFAPNGHGAIKINNFATYYIEIVKEIEFQLQAKDGMAKERAVLVFFDTKKKVDDFLDSAAMSRYRSQVVVMKEEDTVVNREAAVRLAVVSKSITLLSRDFGRGTDFHCYDKEMNASGGLHVIQTFVSLEVSEQTQIKGRTARQGNKGSYSLILLDSELEAFKITPAMIIEFENKGLRYDGIDKNRKSTFDSTYSTAIQLVSTIQQGHLESESFLSALYRNDVTEVREFIRSKNKGPALSEDFAMSRTICLMDATGSMSELLDKAKMTVQTMFERAHTILEDVGYPQAFEMQFAVYRNYNAMDEILEFSTWESKPENLRAFMNGVSASYGQGNEAIEIGLWHVNREIQAGGVSQVILIGDMPPNTQDEVRIKRAGQGTYFGRTVYAEPTYYEEELHSIINAGIPVHAFYVEEWAETAFQYIALMTEGQSGLLDIESADGAEMLTGIVTRRILMSINKNKNGGAEGEKMLNDAYFAKYGSSAKRGFT